MHKKCSPLHRLHSDHLAELLSLYVEMILQGIGSELMKLVVKHLKSIDCTQIMLHASPEGKFVYTKLGFLPDESSMVLPVSDQVPGSV